MSAAYSPAYHVRAAEAVAIALGIPFESALEVIARPEEEWEATCDALRGCRRLSELGAAYEACAAPPPEECAALRLDLEIAKVNVGARRFADLCWETTTWWVAVSGRSPYSTMPRAKLEECWIKQKRRADPDCKWTDIELRAVLRSVVGGGAS